MFKKFTDVDLLSPLSSEEMEELDQFLGSDATSYETMMISSLDGYLTAIVIGPTTLTFNQWFPGIWGPDEEDAPDFKDQAEAERIINLIVRHMNSIVSRFELDPYDVELVLDSEGDDEDEELLDGEMWAYGFMQGVDLCRQDWKPLFDDNEGASVFFPIYLLGSDGLTPEQEALVETIDQSSKITELFHESVAWIYSFWLPYRRGIIKRDVAKNGSSEKIGRNESCPCGSGKKFKKCCGTATVLH